MKIIQIAIFSYIISAISVTACPSYESFLNSETTQGTTNGGGCSQYQIALMENNGWVDFLRTIGQRINKTHYPIRLQQAHEASSKSKHGLAILRLDESSNSIIWITSKTQDILRARVYTSLVAAQRNSEILNSFASENTRIEDELKRYPYPHKEHIVEWPEDNWSSLKCLILKDDLEGDFQTVLASNALKTCFEDS